MSAQLGVAGLNARQRQQQATLRNTAADTNHPAFKPGPQKSDLDTYQDEDDTGVNTMITSISHDIRHAFTANGGVRYQNLTSSREMVTAYTSSYMKPSHNSGSVGVQLKTRVSVAASAFGKEVNYVSGGDPCDEQFTWGTFDTAVSAGSALGRSLHGYNGPYPYPMLAGVGGGAPAPQPTRAFNSAN